MVFQAGFSTTVVTWTLTLAQATWSDDQLARIEKLGTPLARFFSILDRPNREFNESVGVPGSTHPDSLTAMLLFEPDLVTASSRVFVEIETASELTRGYSLMDRRVDRAGQDFNATVIDEIDADGFYARYVELLTTPVSSSAKSS